MSRIVGVGRRPLLQKMATVTVAISLTIATADTFRVAERQYNQGYMDSSQLVDNVVDSLEIRIIRVISDTFLWLAQVQTLIRLFPRHKEKVAIKWLGFVMVSLDTIFSILDSFLSGNPRTRPRKFQDAIPALNYLFELAISLIYASCVIYYCLSKRRFAFWHPKMKNICLVAVLSLISVAIPVVFFVLDISQPNLAGWGEYIRWVGAAAASVVVWEWVERIESLERDERKDGILGREVFDGDEMLNMTPSDDSSWPGHDHNSGDAGGNHQTMGESVLSQYKRLRGHLPLRKRRKGLPADGISTGADASTEATNQRITRRSQVADPPQTMSPPSRSDTGSAASTVYAIRYHNMTSPSPNLQPEIGVPHNRTDTNDAPKNGSERSDSESSPSASEKEMELVQNGRKGRETSGRHLWHVVPNAFKRRRTEPPIEVADAQTASGMRRSPIDRNLNLRTRFASMRRDRFAGRGNVPIAPLPVTVIPAPQSNDRTWSPDNIAENSGAVDPMIASEPQQGLPAAQVALYNPGQVVIIPAPSQGRTWSPDDMHHSGSPHQPFNGGVQRPEPAATRTPGAASGDTPAVPSFFTSRGSLTISETQPRASRTTNGAYSTSHRPSSARTSAISAIAEDMGDELRHEGEDRRGTATPSHSDAAQMPQPEPDTAATSSDTARVVTPRLSAQDEYAHAEEGESWGAEDGRDTGGTASGD